ncbi:MAG: ribosome recycling factor [Gammaproteobacteria bacterium]|jgi:ribosome recycling factor
MTEDIIRDAEKRMNKSLETMKNELSKIRSGRAHPSLLEHIIVPYYDGDVPLNQVASISVVDARTLNVSVWDKNAISAVEKAIMTSDLGLNPQSVGESLKVPLPALTEERRKELIKVVRTEVEKGKVSIRNIRRDANNHLKDLVKEKEISEDDERRAEERVQKLTDTNISTIDKLLGTKESELMEI